jgi:small subunit ribosomal protein S18
VQRRRYRHLDPHHKKPIDFQLLLANHTLYEHPQQTFTVYLPDFGMRGTFALAPWKQLLYFSGLSQGLSASGADLIRTTPETLTNRVPLVAGGCMAPKTGKKKRRRFMLRRKRTLDPTIPIDFKKPDTLKRFITDRGKIIPRRISGATASQQREITVAIKRARYLGLLPCSVSHRPERGFAGEMAAANAGGFRDSRGPGGPGGRFGDRGPRDFDRGGRDFDDGMDSRDGGKDDDDFGGRED